MKGNATFQIEISENTYLKVSDSLSSIPRSLGTLCTPVLKIPISWASAFPTSPEWKRHREAAAGDVSGPGLE